MSRPRAWSTFPSTSPGKLGDGANTAGNRRTGQIGGPACRFEGRLEVSGNWGGRLGRSPDGDPSGSSSGEDSGRLRGLPAADTQVSVTIDREVERRPGCETSAGDSHESHSSGTQVQLRLPKRSWVPGPTPIGNENPERVEASAFGSLGVSRVWAHLSRACTMDRYAHRPCRFDMSMIGPLRSTLHLVSFAERYARSTRDVRRQVPDVPATRRAPVVSGHGISKASSQRR